MKSLITCVVTVLASASLFAQGWTWQQPLPQGNILHGVSFSDANNGTAVGRVGTIVRTTDGGATWLTQESGTEEIIYSVSFPDSATGIAVGGHGIIRRTTDAGVTWVSVSTGSSD